MPIVRPPKPRKPKIYQANPSPTTATSGPQGQYGAMLPSGNVGPSPLVTGGGNSLYETTAIRGNVLQPNLVNRSQNPLTAGFWTGTNPLHGAGAGGYTPVSLANTSRIGSNDKGIYVGEGPEGAMYRPRTILEKIQHAFAPQVQGNTAYPEVASRGQVPNYQINNKGTYIGEGPEGPMYSNAPKPYPGYGQQAAPKPTNVFTPQPANFDYQANVIERNQQATSLLAQGQWPTTLSAQDAQTLGIGQDLINAGYQMVGGQLVAPNGGASPLATNQPSTGIYGNYAEGNKLYSGQAKTAQEAFQQGAYKPSKRWWIGRGKTHGENAAQAAGTPTTGGWTNQIGMIDFNTGT